MQNGYFIIVEWMVKYLLIEQITAILQVPLSFAFSFTYIRTYLLNKSIYVIEECAMLCMYVC